jgi:hypothetical protein
LRLKLKPGLDDAFTVGISDGFGPFARRSRLILVPVRFPALVAFEPFKEPVLGPIKITIDALGGLPLKVALNRLFTKLLFHRNAPVKSFSRIVSDRWNDLNRVIDV